MFFSLLPYFLLVFVLSWNSTFFNSQKNNHLEPENAGGLLQMISLFQNGVIFSFKIFVKGFCLISELVESDKKSAWMSQEVSKW